MQKLNYFKKKDYFIICTYGIFKIRNIIKSVMRSKLQWSVHAARKEVLEWCLGEFYKIQRRQWVRLVDEIR